MALRVVFLCLLILMPMKAHAEMTPAFAAWFDQFAHEAMAQGIAPVTLQKVVTTLDLDESVIELDQKQPEGKITFAAYLKNNVTDARVKKGRELMLEHKDLLDEISKRSGVPSSVIVSLWAIESSYGDNMGDYDVINSLATLAFEGRRAAFFKKELIEALRILEEEVKEPMDLKGSWAGAMGQCQFMPSTYRNHAIDFDNDGKRDIWESETDVLASIANYLTAEGWREGVKWGQEVKLTKPIDEAQIGTEQLKSLKEWSTLGVKTLGNKALQQEAVMASLIQPDGSSGRSFLVYDNFFALMRWNRSTYFATTVGLLADQLSSHK